MHAHDLIGISHQHVFSGLTGLGMNPDFSSFTSSTSVTGETDIASPIPPYHSKTLIMYDGRLR